MKRIYEAFVTGDVAYIVDQLTDDVHWFSHVDPVVPISGDWSGRADVPGFFAAIGENLDIASFAPAEFYADGEVVVSTGRLGATSKPDGKPIDSAWIFVLTFADGKIASYEQFHDWALATAFR